MPDAELTAINPSSVWHLWLRVYTRIALIIGSILLAIILLIEFLLLQSNPSFGLVMILTVVGFPLLVGVGVVLNAFIRMAGAWVYTRFRPVLGGIQFRQTLEAEKTIVTNITLAPVLRWLGLIILVGVVIYSFFIGLVIALLYAIGYTHLISEIAGLFLLNELVKVVAIFVAGALTVLLYNSMGATKRMAFTFGAEKNDTRVNNVQATRVAFWTMVYVTLYQAMTLTTTYLVPVLRDASTEATGPVAIAISVVFVAVFGFLGAWIFYDIYNWGAKKWGAILVTIIQATPVQAQNATKPSTRL